MQITVKFTNVYGGREHHNTQTFDVKEVSADTIADGGDSLEDWAYANIFPQTGDGNAEDADAGYFAEVLDCAEQPALVGREFSWGV